MPNWKKLDELRDMDGSELKHGDRVMFKGWFCSIRFGYVVRSINGKVEITTEDHGAQVVFNSTRLLKTFKQY